MLPNLAGLGLQAHQSAPTAEPYILNNDEVLALSGVGTVEIFSQDTPVAGEETFRIAKRRNARPDVMDDYDWFEPVQLWQWAKTHDLDPLRKPWWHEDWIALRNKHGPGFQAPAWVNTLPRLVSEYGPYNPRLEWPTYQGVVTWERRISRDPGWAILSDGAMRYRVYDVNADVDFYEGVRGQEHRVRAWFEVTGRVEFYEGPAGQESLVRIQYPDPIHWSLVGYDENDEHPFIAYIEFFEGPAGQERKVRQEAPGMNVFFYEGPAGQERYVRAEWDVTGRVEFYEGPAGQEHLVRQEWLNGTVDIYEGPRGQERKAFREYPSGKQIFYDGPGGQERKVRREYPSGKQIFYDGPRGQERKVHVENARAR